MADILGLHRCPVCFKTYKRREHLQRHRSSHTSERPHRCMLCGAAFQRSDVLKRHLQTCDGDASSSSSRRRACDRCVRQKKACNSVQPCLNCEKRSVECHYSGSAVPASSSTQHATPPVGVGPCHPTLEGTIPHAQHDPGPSHPAPVDSTFHHVPFDDLDTLIQQTVSQFPLPGGWFGVDFSQPGQTANLRIEPFHHEPQPPRRAANSRYRGYSFTFLNDFTSRTGLVSSFECATLSQRQQIVSAFRDSYPQQQLLDLPVAVPPLSAPPDGIPTDVSPLNTDPESVHNGLSSWSFWLYNPIVIKLQKVVLLVKNVVLAKPNNSIIALTWSSALEQQCLQFFSPARFSKFIELYWSVWHPNVNFLNRATFDPTSAKSILLAGMALIGACVSPDPADNEDAKMWFNCVEEMVFTDDDFCRDIEPPAASEITLPENRRKLQALQAAYLVCLYQNWEGNDASKRRIRRHRFSTVVSTARDLGIDNARHLDYAALPKHEFIWLEYVAREELIRIFIWIFLLDTAFVIFNNLPHRMVIKEMKMHVATPEACFQAASAEECIDQIHRWMPPGSPFCSLLLREAIENLCLDNMTQASQEQFAQLGPVNLFAMVSAIHYMIFQHQNLFAVEGQLVPIRNGLKNWIGIWEKYVKVPSTLSPHGLLQEDCGAPELMWKRIGFVRFSAEYWLLGSLLTDRLSATTVTTPDLSSANGSSSADLQASPNARGKARCPDPILEKYDQTSMRQVNDLINDFQKFNIG